MSEQERPERLTETLALLGRLTPVDVPADRDALFFRAGEESARGEVRALPAWSQRVWPTIAATLSFVALGLGYALVAQQPEVQVVYVERGSRELNPEAAGVDKPNQPDPPASDDDAAASFARRGTLRDIPYGVSSDIIHPRDWAALSDAFAQQLRLQHQRREALASVDASAAEQDRPQTLNDTQRDQSRTYLELRDAMRAM